MTARTRGSLKLLYELDMTADVRNTWSLAWVRLMSVPGDARRFYHDAGDRGAEQPRGIDTVIRTWSSHWSWHRIGMVERITLCLAIFE